MSDELNQLYQEVILDHSRKPHNFTVLEDATCQAEGNNPLCGDHYTIYTKLENGVISKIAFQGGGCAISKAAASMMTDLLKGKTEAEAKLFFDQYHKLVTTGESSGGPDLGKLHAFAGVRQFPMRVKCAILPWHAMLASISDKSAAVQPPHEHS